MQSSTGMCPRWSIASGISYPISALTSAMYFSRKSSPFFVMWIPVNGWAVLKRSYASPRMARGSIEPWGVENTVFLYSRIFSKKPSGAQSAPSTSARSSMPKSIFRNVYPCAIRSLRALPMSRPPPSLSVSQYMRILSRYFPPSSCHTGTPHALPAMSHRATSMPQTPPACRESPPNCFMRLKIFSTLHGFSPRILLLSIAAYVLLDASRTSP